MPPEAVEESSLTVGVWGGEGDLTVLCAVQVRVQHDPTRSLQLPLRVKAFAVTQEEREALPEWLPPELRSAPPPILGTIPVPPTAPGMDLKGPTVLSHTFRSYIVRPPRLPNCAVEEDAPRMCHAQMAPAVCFVC